ncbi:phosphatidic acid phosphatase type 2/haloperoxidase [Hyaloraphidium curvatum]|nr:phosphatidic acid phosphatase type 2/haloperoxidase [Hyaloraphidium curvatum]
MMRAAALAALATALCALFATADAGAASDWNAVLLQRIRDTSLAPPRAARALAMLHVAMFDAVNGISPGYSSYAVARSSLAAGAAPGAAAAAAARGVLNTLFPASASTTNATFAQAISANGEPAAAVSAGIRWGDAVAAAIVALRANDGSDAVVAYDLVPGPEHWKPTPPTFVTTPLLPQWPRVTPFGVPAEIDDENPESSFAVPEAPPAISSPQYAEELIEVMGIGAANSAVRTPEQTNIARYWAQGGGTSTPPGMWNTIAAGIVQQRSQAGNPLPELEEARLFALINIATADAGISCWTTKYRFNSIRPVTAARTSDPAINPALPPADPSWTPLLVTPPFPAYTSGHSTFSGAASNAIRGFFGTDNVPFTAPTDFPGIAPRSFASLSSAADEAGMSRIYGGIHVSSDNVKGLAMGRAIGTYVSRNLLRPIRVECPAFYIGAVSRRPDLQIGIPVWNSSACDAPLNSGGAQIYSLARRARPFQACNSVGKFEVYNAHRSEWQTHPMEQMEFYATGFNIQRRNCEQDSRAFTDLLTGMPLRLRLVCSNGAESGWIYFYWGTASTGVAVSGISEVSCTGSLLDLSGR